MTLLPPTAVCPGHSWGQHVLSTLQCTPDAINLCVMSRNMRRIRIGWEWKGWEKMYIVLLRSISVGRWSKAVLSRLPVEGAGQPRHGAKGCHIKLT